MAVKKQKLNLITVVVQHRFGNDVLNAALKAGATYYYAQGTGVRQDLGAAYVQEVTHAVGFKQS